MEQERKKREREGEDRHSYQEHPTKKQHQDKETYSASNQHTAYENAAAIDYFCSSGVFDFPWLNEDMISKSEDWKLEDTFWSSLGDFPEPCSCQTPIITVDLLPDRVDNQPWKCEDHDLENLDNCIWSSVLNQPLVEEDV